MASGAIPQHRDADARAIRKAFEEQHLIGWHLACRGFLAASWFGEEQRQHSAKRGKNGVMIHKEIFAAFLSLWAARNEELHGDILTQRQKQDTQLAAQVRDCFKEGTKILPSDRGRIFPCTTEEMLRKPRAAQKQWLRLAAKMLPGALQRAKTVPKGQKLLTCYWRRSGLADDPP